MTQPWRLPGAGFVLWLVTTSGAVALVVWGALTPRLERVQSMLLELEVGERGPLDDGERELLEDVLRRHPRVAADLLDGAPAGIIGGDGRLLVERDCAYLVRMGGTAAALELSLPEAEQRRVEVHVSAAGASTTGHVGPGSPLVWRLPPAGGGPQVVEIRQPASAADLVPLALRVRESR